MTDWKMPDPPKKIDGTDMKVWKCARMCVSSDRSICVGTFVDSLHCEPQFGIF